MVVIGYYFILPPSNTAHPYTVLSHQTQTALLSGYVKHYMPQAIVFIAMGKLAGESLVEDSISTVRLLGHWTEHVYILTDRQTCFADLAARSPQTTIVNVPSKKSIMEIKTMKAEIFSYLPTEVSRVLYMDVDILITRNIGFFLNDLTHQMFYYQHTQQQKHLRAHDSTSKPTKEIATKQNTSTSATAPLPLLQLDFAAFLDAKGHYVGFCSGCEKWHTGVMFLTRSANNPKGQNPCMASWAHVLSSGMFNTDQESLDFVEKNGSCPNAMSLSARHLLFAKDYIGMTLTSGQTFIHLTAANRAEEQDYFYRSWIMPRIRNSLHPPLRPYDPLRKKTC